MSRVQIDVKHLNIIQKLHNLRMVQSQNVSPEKQIPHFFFNNTAKISLKNILSFHKLFFIVILCLRFIFFASKSMKKGEKIEN